MVSASRKSFGVVIIIISSLCFAIVPTSAKVALDFGASLFVLLFSRCVMGFFLLSFIIFFHKKNLEITKGTISQVILCSFFSVTLIWTIYSAIIYIDISIVLTILYSFPILIALVVHFRGEQKTLLSEWFLMIIICLGLALLISERAQQHETIGIWLSFLGLLLMTSFIYLSSRVSGKIGTSELNFHINFWSLIFLLIALWLYDLEVEFPKNYQGVSALVLNGIFYVLSYTLFFLGSNKIGIKRASVLSTTEPLFGTIVAIIFLNQMLNLVELIGFLIVLTALFFFEKQKNISTTVK